MHCVGGNTEMYLKNLSESSSSLSPFTSIVLLPLSPSSASLYINTIPSFVTLSPPYLQQPIIIVFLFFLIMSFPASLTYFLTTNATDTTTDTDILSFWLILIHFLVVSFLVIFLWKFFHSNPTTPSSSLSLSLTFWTQRELIVNQWMKSSSATKLSKLTN